MRRHWSAVYIVGAVVLTLIIGLLGNIALPIRWLLIMVVFVGLLALIGRDVTGEDREVEVRRGRTEWRRVPGRADGVLIDLRRKVSLSRLQLILWTVIVLSAYATLALHRTIPVLQGQLAGSGSDVVRSVATVLAGERAVDDAQMERARGVLEQLTGQDMSEEPSPGDTPRNYSPLDINFPPQLLVLLGLSVASLAGANAIKTNRAASEDGRITDIVEGRIERAEQRADQAQTQLEGLESMRDNTLESMNAGLESLDADPAAAEKARREAEAQLAQLEARMRAAEQAAAAAEARVAKMQAVQEEAVGELQANPSIAEARWSDMVRGDTIANFEFADLGKIQMLLFTVVLVFAYAALIWSIMSMPGASRILQLAPSITFPPFSDSLVVTMGLSQAGYLSTKATT